MLIKCSRKRQTIPARYVYSNEFIIHFNKIIFAVLHSPHKKVSSGIWVARKVKCNVKCQSKNPGWGIKPVCGMNKKKEIWKSTNFKICSTEAEWTIFRLHQIRHTFSFSSHKLDIFHDIHILILKRQIYVFLFKYNCILLSKKKENTRREKFYLWVLFWIQSKTIFFSFSFLAVAISFCRYYLLGFLWCS